MVTENELVAAHLPMAYALADRYWLPNGDTESLRQEALIAALLAIRSYNPTIGAPLAAYVRLVVERRLATVLRLTWMEKRRAQNEAISSGLDEDGEPCEIVALLPGGRDPLEEVVAHEEFRTLIAGIRALTPLEREALVGFVFSGVQQDKRTDNAIQRARTKLRRAA